MYQSQEFYTDNYKGDPICCSIEDIVKTFYLSGLDAIIINNYLLEK